MPIDGRVHGMREGIFRMMEYIDEIKDHDKTTVAGLYSVYVDNKSLTTAYVVIDTLEAVGWINRMSDGRLVRYELTAYGRKVYNAFMRAYDREDRLTIESWMD